ncbi:MAG: 3-deoxy-manno-octulosonate cytidylyltransferase [Bacteroidetes bacterium]|nr:MAG: 3-deoxy-manno-octulosonate cytidylyltransferase [Bacteroidota bacterium]
MKILGIIPARYASSRLPAKPLAMIGKKTLIERVYQQAKQAKTLSKVMIATDDERIFQHCKNIGADVMMTSVTHSNGTDRCAEVMQSFKNEFQAAINIQGDEPFVNPIQIDQLGQLFIDDNLVEIATLSKKIKSYEELIDEREAKIVLNQNQECIYMSRSAVPFLRNEPIQNWHQKADYYKHIGIYGFRADILSKIPTLPISILETQEGLEQLRWLAYFKIKIGFTDFETLAIDTPNDLLLAEKFLLDNHWD